MIPFIPKVGHRISACNSAVFSLYVNQRWADGGMLSPFITIMPHERQAQNVRKGQCNI